MFEFARALKSMCMKVKSCIKYKSFLSEFFYSHMGLKQGDPSSPLIFMMFINDIVDNINSDLENILMLLYAYDAVLFAKSSESLRSTLHDTEIYCGTWNLKINTSKTKAMIFERGRHTNCE